MLKFLVCSVLLVTLVNLSGEVSANSSKLTVTGVTCPEPETNDLCESIICETKHVQDEPPKLTVGCNLKETSDEFWLSYSVFRKNTKNENYRMISWREEDVCGKMTRMSLSGLKSSIIFQIAMKYAANVEEFLHVCPYEKGWTVMKDLQTKNLIMPPFLDNGEYYADFRYFNGDRNETIMNARFNFVVSTFKKDDENKLGGAK